MTRAERREAREAECRRVSPAVPLPRGAAGAASAGRGLWAATTRTRPESARIASAADYRDDVGDVPGDQDEPAEVYPAADSGTGTDMSDDARTDTAEHTHAELSHDDGLGAGGAAAAARPAPGATYAATRGDRC